MDPQKGRAPWKALWLNSLMFFGGAEDHAETVSIARRCRDTQPTRYLSEKCGSCHCAANRQSSFLLGLASWANHYSLLSIHNLKVQSPGGVAGPSHRGGGQLTSSILEELGTIGQDGSLMSHAGIVGRVCSTTVCYNSQLSLDWALLSWTV